MTTIHYSRQIKRRNETAFADSIVKAIPAAVVVPRTPKVELHHLERFVRTKELIEALRADALLPPRKRNESIDLLEDLPNRIKIADRPSRVSCDLSIESATGTYFYEFHEKQHRRLNVRKSSPLYAPNGTRYEVPRFLQRFIRDVWRFCVLPNFTVVWFDWFAGRKAFPSVCPVPGVHEYSLPGRFSFRTFCEAAVPPNHELQRTGSRSLRSLVTGR